MQRPATSCDLNVINLNIGMRSLNSPGCSVIFISMRGLARWMAAYALRAPPGSNVASCNDIASGTLMRLLTFFTVIYSAYLKEK